MKLRLPNKLVAALMAAMSATVFTTLSTGSFAYADPTTYNDLTAVDYFETNEHVYNTGKGTFYLETSTSTLSLTLTLNLDDFAKYQGVHDYGNAGYYSNFVTWTYNYNPGATYGMADVATGYSGVNYSGVTGMWNGLPWTTGTNITFNDDFRANYADADGNVTLTITNNPTPTTSNVVVTAVNKTSGATQTLYTANGLRSNDYVNQHVTAFTVNMNYVKSVTLNSESILDSSGFTAPKDYTIAFDKTQEESVGRVVFLGDSITHGVQDMSYRWDIFKTFVDNGIENEIAGPLSGYHSDPLNGDYNGNYSSSQYGGATFDNAHYAQSSGRTHNMLTASNSGNSLGGSTGVNYGGVTSVKVGKEYNGDTYIMMMGTNDILSDGADTVDKMATVTNRLLGEGSLANGTWSNAGVESPLVGLTNDNVAYRGEWGTIGKIIDNMKMDAGDTMYVMPVPTWGVGRTGLHVYADLVPAYNEKLEAWTKAYSSTHTGTVKYVDINRGLVDKTLNGRYLAPDAFFRTTGGDYIHPNEQGALIIAGNLAQGMGIAGRTAGLVRSAANAAGWTALGRDIHLNSGESERLLTNVFTEANGYSVDFSAVFGNGDADGWLNKNNALSIYIGDGTNAGALKLSEGYISWNDKLLFCQDNSLESNDRIRVAYHNGNAEQNISSGYYVWLGDMLIGQGLGNESNLSFNGVTVYAAGADAAVKGLSYANTAYAPTSKLMAGTPLTTTQAVGNASVIETGNVLLPLFNHNNKTGATLGVNFSADGVGSVDNGGTAATNATAGTAVTVVMAPTDGFYGAVKGYTRASGDVTAKVASSNVDYNAFGVVNGSLTTGNITMVFGDGVSVNSGSYNSGSAQGAFLGAFNGNIGGKLAVELQDATMKGNVIMGVVSGNQTVGSTQLLVNGGATIDGNVYGGSIIAGATITNDIDITVTGGSITRDLIGTGTAGTVGGDVNILITGGTIGGNVTARDSRVNMTKENATANLTVEGNLAKIGGNISADNVTFRNVETQEYSDTFDKFSGAVTAADTLTLHNYNAAQVGSAVSAQHVRLTGNSHTTIRNLTLTACTIEAQDGSDVTLEGTLTLGNTATYTGTVYVANGLVFSMTDAALGNAAAEYTYSQGTSGFRTISSATLLTPGDDSRLKAVGGAALTETNVNTYTGTGALEGATFSYNAETGVLSAAPVNQVGSGTFYVNDAVTYDTNTPAYAADALVINNGGTLTFNTELKDNVSVTVAESGAAIGINEGKHLGGVALADGVTGFALSGAGELLLTSADAATMLTGVTGTGTMRLTENAFLNGEGATAADPAKSLSTGTFIVGNGEGNQVQLQIGSTTTGGSYNDHHSYATIKSFNSVVLDNGKLWYQVDNTAGNHTVNNLTVTSGGGEIYIEDSNAKATFNLNGTTTLQGNLSLLSNWKDNAFVIANLTGEGNLSLGGTANAPQLQLNSFAGWSGTLTHTQGTARYYIGLNAANSTAHLSTFNVDSGTAQIRLKDSNYANALLIDNVTLANNATMQAYYANWGGSTANYSNVRLEIGSLTMSGANASLATTNHGGQISVGSITGTGTLTLSNTSSSNVHSTYILGGNATEAGSTTFSGTVVMHHNNNGNQRGMVVMLNDTYTMANADLQVKAVQTGYNRVLGVGISTDHAKLGGLNDQDVKSGGATLPYSLFSAPSSALEAQFTDVANYFDGNDGTMRTLEMTGSGTYSTGIRVMEGINLVMSGTGSQTFSGDMSRFNGNVAVNSGTLALTGTGLTLRGTVANAGTLNLSGDIAVNTDKLWNYEVKAPAEGNTYSDGENGYLENATMYLVKSNGGTLNSTASFTGKEVTNDGAGNLTFTASDTTTYYVNTGALTYDDSTMGGASNLYIAKDAALTANGAPTSAKVLTGEGTFNLATVASKSDIALPTGVTLSDTDWQGIVHLTSNGGGDNATHGVTNITEAQINALGNASSWVEFENFHGYLQNAAQTITANLILTGDSAISITADYDKTRTFTGDIKGSGNLVHTYAANTLQFSGDISGWTGAIQKGSNDTRSTTLNYSGKATDIETSINYTGTSGFNLTFGAITNGAEGFTFAESVKANLVTLSGQKVSFDGDTTLNQIATSSNNSTSTLGGSGDITIVGPSADAALKVATAGVTLNIEADNLTIRNSDYSGYGDTNRKRSLAITGNGATVNINSGVTTVYGATYTGHANATLNIGTGEQSATLVTTRLEMGDATGGSTTLDGTHNYLNVGSHGKLVVTGTQNNVGDAANTALVLSEWNSSVVADIEGKFYGKDAVLTSNDYPLFLTVSEGGILAVKGLDSTRDRGTAAFNLTLQDGGKLILGSEGLKAARAATPWTINLNGGEIGMTADMTMTRAMTLNGDVTFNTAKYTWSGEAAAQEVVAGTEGGTMTISNVLSGEGGLIKTGAGTLVLSGANTFTGDILVSGGTLKVGNGQALGAFDSSRNIVISEGGVLDVNGNKSSGSTGYTVTLDGGTLTNSGAVVRFSDVPQFVTNLRLTADSYVQTQGTNFGLIDANSTANSIELGDYDLIKTGSGNYMLDKTTITGTGNLVVREGNIQFRSNGGACSLQSDIVLEGGGVIGEGQGVVLGADVSMKSNAAGSYVSAPVKTEGHNLTVGGTVNMTMNGVISGNGSVTKADANAITMTAANNYTGGTTIEDGALILTDSNALSSSVVTFADRTAEQAPYRTLAFTTGASYNGATGALTGGTPINGTIAGLSGYRGTVVADTLTINVAEGGNYEFLHRYSNGTTNDAAVLDVNKLVKTGAGTQVIGGEYTADRGFEDGLVIANGIDVQQGTLHLKTRGAVTANFDVREGATLKTTDDVTNQVTASAAVKYDGTVTLHGTTAANAGTLNYTDGSTYITNALAVDGNGKLNLTWGKLQYVQALTGTNATLTVDRNSGDGSRGGYVNILSNGSYSGTINLITRAGNEMGGLIMHDAADALANTVVNFGTTNDKSLVAFITGDGTFNANRVLTTDTFTNGSVGGLDGSKGSVKAAELTINTAEGGNYAYSGDLTVTDLVKSGAGSQSLAVTANLNSLDVQGGTLNVTGGALTVTEPITIGNGGTLSLNATSNGQQSFIHGSVTVGNGGKLVLAQHDATGYKGGDNALHDIHVQTGGEMLLGFSNSNETFVGNLTLDGTLAMEQGYSGSRIDLFTDNGHSAKVMVSNGANGVVAEGVKLELRQDDSEFAIGTGGSLTVNGTITKTGSGAGNNSFRKTGEGEMIINTALDNGNGVNNINVEEGALTLNADAKVTGTLTLGSSATLNIAAEKRLELTAAATAGDKAYGGVTGSGTLAMNLTTGDNGVQTGVTLGSTFNGTLELTGHLRAESDLGGTSLVKFSGSGAGLVFTSRHSGEAMQHENPFARDIELADATTLSVATWGNSNNTDDNIISGTITGGSNTAIVKKDTGHLTISGDLSNFHGDVKAESGDLLITGAPESGYTLKAIHILGGNVNLAGGSYTINGTDNTGGLFNGNGKLTIESGASLLLNAHMSSNEDWQFEMQGGTNKGVAIEKGATFTLDTNHSGDSTRDNVYNLVVAGVDAETPATITAEVNRNYNIKAENITIADADVTFSKETAGNFANKLENSSFTNAGSTAIALTNGESTLTALHAQAGNITVENGAASADQGGDRNNTSSLKSIKATGGNVMLHLQGATSVSLNELVLQGGHSVSADTTVNTSPVAMLAEGDETPTYAANIKVGGVAGEQNTATFEADGVTTINANLTVAGNTQMVYGSDVPQGVDGGVNLAGNSLTLSAEGGNILITSKMLETLNDTRHLTLFSNVGGLTLNGVDFSQAMTKVNDTLYVTTAKDFFSDAQRNPLGDQYTVAYNTVTKELYLAPEPTTAALSLLALGALAARRRRR